MTINKDYPCNSDNYTRGRALPVSYIVIHYVGATGGAKANAKYFAQNVNTNSSAHYFVGHASEGGAVYQSVSELDTAWHCGRTDGKYLHPECRNANSIGIEMCCHKDASGNWYFDSETISATIELVADIMRRYEIPLDHVVRHYDVTGKICPAPFVYDTQAWGNFKNLLLEKSDDKLTQDQFNSMYAVMLSQQTSATPAEWATEAWKKAIAAGVFDGSAPQSPLTREQAALVLNRLGLLG